VRCWPIALKSLSHKEKTRQWEGTTYAGEAMRKTMLLLALTCMSASALSINPLVPPPDFTPSFEYGDDDLQSTTA